MCIYSPRDMAWVPASICVGLGQSPLLFAIFAVTQATLSQGMRTQSEYQVGTPVCCCCCFQKILVIQFKKACTNFKKAYLVNAMSSVLFDESLHVCN